MKADTRFVARGALESVSLHRPVCDLLGCRYPLVLAGMGGVARSELVSAVSLAGGFGLLGMVRETPAFIRPAVSGHPGHVPSGFRRRSEDGAAGGSAGRGGPGLRSRWACAGPPAANRSASPSAGRGRCSRSGCGGPFRRTGRGDRPVVGRAGRAAGNGPPRDQGVVRARFPQAGDR